MKETIIPAEPEKKIIALKEEDTPPESIKFDLLVYSYKRGSYDGSGFAVWRYGGNWFYHELGHCSCYGPWDHMNESANMALKFEDVAKLAEDHYSDHGKDVIKWINENVQN